MGVVGQGWYLLFRVVFGVCSWSLVLFRVCWLRILQCFWQPLVMHDAFGVVMVGAPTMVFDGFGALYVAVAEA